MNKYFNKSVVLRKYIEVPLLNAIGILSNESLAKVFSKKVVLNNYIGVRKIEVK